MFISDLIIIAIRCLSVPISNLFVRLAFCLQISAISYNFFFFLPFFSGGAPPTREALGSDLWGDL